MTERETIVMLCNAAHWVDNSLRKSPDEQRAIWMAVIDRFGLTRDQFGVWR